MRRTLSVGRRTTAATTVAPDAVAVADEHALHEVFEDVVALASEPLEAVAASGVSHARVGKPVGPSAESIRDRELTIISDALAVVRDVTSVMERGSTPAVAAHEQALELAREQSRQAFDLARTIAGREQPVPNIHMHLPEHNVDVRVEGSQFTLPPLETHLHAGDTHVSVPEQPVPHVDVFVPRQEPTVVHVAPAAPEVVVQPAPVVVQAAASPANRGVRVTVDEDGNKVYESVEIAPPADGE